MSKVILAYSGGLETTAAIHWLAKERGLKVIALGVNVGQGAALDEVAERALLSGADRCHVIDLRRTFLRNFCWKALRASAKYEGVYLMSAALSRPLIATELVRLAHEEGATMVAHGAPPRGNDQFRIECSVAALDPTIQIVAPMREWKMKTREEVLAYAAANKLETDKHSRDQYTHDFNLWGARCSGGDMVDLTKPVAEAAYSLTVDPLKAPEQPQDVELSFVKGDPVKVNGEKLDSIELMEAVNKLGAAHGVGRLDMIENNLMGFKNREVYESPGATVLHCAHDALERLVLDKAMLTLKRQLATVYAETVYDGLWFSSTREALDAFVASSQEFVTGDVTVRLFRGTASAVAGYSEFSTYDREQEMLAAHHGSLPEGAAEGMLTIARMLQLNRGFKQKPRT